MRLLLGVLVLLGAVSAGCTAQPYGETFDAASLGDEWQAFQGTWRIADAAADGRVLEGRGTAEPGLSSLVQTRIGRLDAFELQVHVALLSGADPQGVGVVVDWQDAQNYVIVRYSTHEHGWHLFTVVDGTREKRAEATLASTTDPGFNRWSRLRVVHDDKRIEAFDGDVPVIAYDLPTAIPASGFVGLFVRGDSRAYFDDFYVKAS